MLLNYTDEQIWNTTPRLFFAQLAVHAFLNGNKKDTKSTEEATGFIDQVQGW